MPWQLALIRGVLRSLPVPLRLRLARRLFLTVRQHKEPAREARWRARGQVCTVGQMAATKFGDGERVVWLIHGWEGRGLQLSAFIEPLVAGGCTVYALDGPGHGRTPGRGGFVPFAVAMQEGLQEGHPHAIIGHSMGAAAAIIAASREGFVGCIACLGGPPDTAMVLPRAMDFMGIDRRHEARFMAMVRKPFEDVGMDLRGALEMHDRARGCAGPLRAWLAEGDEEIPNDESRAIVEAGDGLANVVPGVGHRNIMWHPETVAEAVRFVLVD